MLPPKNEKPLTAKKLTPKTYRPILVYCFRQSRYRRKMKNRLPPKSYRRIALPPKKYRHIFVYRFRLSRYRRKRENRHPPKKKRRMAIRPRLCPPKKPLPMTTLEKRKNAKNIAPPSVGQQLLQKLYKQIAIFGPRGKTK